MNPSEESMDGRVSPCPNADQRTLTHFALLEHNMVVGANIAENGHGSLVQCLACCSRPPASYPTGLFKKVNVIRLVRTALKKAFRPVKRGKWIIARMTMTDLEGCGHSVRENLSRQMSLTRISRQLERGERSGSQAVAVLPDDATEADSSSTRSKSITRIWRCAAILAKAPEPRTDILREQFGFFHRGEVAASRHLGPALHIEKSLCPFARRLTDILWEEREGGRHFGRTRPFFDAFLHPSQRARIRVIVVREER
jgi:hypothetical protein